VLLGKPKWVAGNGEQEQKERETLGSVGGVFVCVCECVCARAYNWPSSKPGSGTTSPV
jgi:hypothetical protein